MILPDDTSLLQVPSCLVDDCSYNVGEVGSGRYQGEWWTLVMTRYSDRVEYEMRNDFYGGHRRVVVGGADLGADGRPRSIMVDDHLPEVPMNIQFGIILRGLAAIPGRRRLQIRPSRIRSKWGSIGTVLTGQCIICRDDLLNGRRSRISLSADQYDRFISGRHATLI